MAGRPAPAAHDQDEMEAARAHWPLARPAAQPAMQAPVSQGYAQDHYGYQQPAAPGYAPQETHHQQAPAQGRPEWGNGGHEHDLRAFAQLARPQPQPQAYEPAYQPHQLQQPAPVGHYQAPPHEQTWDQGQAHAYPGQQAYPGHPNATQIGHDHGFAEHPQEGQDPRFAQWQSQQHAGDPNYNLDHYAQQQGHPGFAQQAPGQHGEAHGDHGDYEEYAEEAEPRRGPRAAVVIAALVGAIAVGGGLAYGYRMMGGGKDGGKPPVVKADTAPTKVKPTDAGGKDVAHTDKKFLNRLTEDGKAAGASAAPPSAPTAASPASEPEAPRKVTTLVVNRDGTLTPQANIAPPSAPATPVSAPAAPPPGMVVEGGPRAALRGAASEATAASAAPKVADLPLPKVKAEPPQQASVAFPAPSPAPVQPPTSAVAKKKPAVRDDALAPQAAVATPARAPAATATTGGGAVIGYVAVLTSKKTREDALKSFADLHQKYPDILGSKSPDVVQADIPDKGTFYRLIVGPPGSREAGRDLCKQLDAQGYKGCWITAYRQ